MKPAARKAGLLRIFEVLAENFGAEGWQFTVKPQRSLRMLRTPEANVEHTLLISEVLPLDDLPGGDVSGLSCQVNVYFADLEKIINRALEYDQNAMGKLSVVLPLRALAPKEHFYAGNVHLIPIVTENIAAGCQLLCKDFSIWLEPVRRCLESQAVFEDVTYIPPNVESLSWELRRLAHHYLHSSSSALNDHIAQLEGRVKQALEEMPTTNASPFERLKMGGLKRTALEVSKFIRYCRANPNRAVV